MLGSKQKKVNIIPDYVIYDEGQVKLVIDAKSPNENIESGDNVCQVYSYAIHPEIRSCYFALCNGRKLSVFSIFKTTLLKTYIIPNLNDNDRLDLFQKLRMVHLKHEDVMKFDLDFGLFIILNGFSDNMKFIFMDSAIYTIGKLSDNEYTYSFASNDFTDRKLLISIDFSREQYNNLLKLIPPNKADIINSALSRQPYHMTFDEDPPRITSITDGFKPVTIGNTGEEFIPLKLLEFKQP